MFNNKEAIYLYISKLPLLFNPYFHLANLAFFSS